MSTPIIWGLDVEASGFSIATSDGREAEWRELRGAFDMFRMARMKHELYSVIKDWGRQFFQPDVIYVELPCGGVNERWKHKSLRSTFRAIAVIEDGLLDWCPPEHIREVDYWTWHKALCAKCPIPADIRHAFPKWADHDLQTVAALKARGITVPVNWSTHRVDARAIVEYGLDVWRAEQQDQPQARRKGRGR